MVKLLFQKWHKGYYKWKDIPVMEKLCVRCWKEYIKDRYLKYSQREKSKYCSRECSKYQHKWAKQSIETINKRAESMKWHKVSEVTREKIRQANLWKKHTDDYKKKLSDARKWIPSPMKWIKKPHKSWNNHWNRKGGISSENRRVRISIEYRLWREAVFARDNRTCQKTGQRWIILHPHHILWFAQYPELRFAIDNWISLSIKSHRLFHKRYWTKDNTKEQIEEFLLFI